MPGTMTFVGMDVHGRSIHAAAIDVMSGELTRVRFHWRCGCFSGGMAERRQAARLGLACGQPEPA
jgi:hypothetical protein